MTPVSSGKDYAFLINAPGQLEALFKSYDLTLVHPVLRLPTAEEVVRLLAQPNGRDMLEKGFTEREKLIKLMKADPLRYGYEPRCWADARELLKKYRLLHITSRNRNTKTQFGGKETVLRTQAPERRAWCLCESNETSIRGGGQQEVVWDYLPPEWRAVRGARGRAIEFALNYSPKDRFAGNAAVMPNKSELRFMNYQQDIDIIEGGAIDWFWADELVPVEWVLTLLFRLIDRDGSGLVTFTPKNGWNEAYALIYQSCRVLEWQDFPMHTERQHWPGGPKGKIPYIVESIHGNYAGMFFPPDANPYVPFAKVLEEVAKSSYEVQMIRLAGIARKKIGNQFPKFGQAHILPASKIPKEGTNYHFVDFAWERNWANLWVRVRRIKDRVQYFVYRDWPDKQTHGEWAVRSSKPGGARGPAQDKVGLSVNAYRDLILGLEGHAAAETAREKIYMRFGDPRSGAAEAVTQDEAGISFFSMLAEAGLDFTPVSLLGDNRFIGEGVKQVNDLLDYDEEQFERDGNRFTPFNEPRLFISEECGQVIDCLQLWAAHGAQKDQACKDFIDLLRYMAVENLDDVGGMKMECRGGGSY